MTQSAARYSPLGLAALALDHARLLVLVPLAALVLSVGFTTLTGGEYSASASFTPQTRQAETARLAGLASQFGLNMGGLGGGDGESVDFYARLARSRALLAQVALHEYRFAEREAGADTLSGNLLALLGIEGRNESARMLAAVHALEQMITVELDMSANVVTVTTRAAWPGLAEQINRALLDEINRFNLERRQSHAAAERRFVEAQIARAQADLDAAEGELGTFLQHNRRYEEWPQARFEAAKLQRRVELQQQVYTTLAQRLEQARVDEVRNTPVITIIDAPEGSAHSEASLVKNGLLSMIVAVGLVIGFLLMREYGMRLRTQYPDEYDQLRSRSRALLPRRRARDLSAALLPLLLPLLALTACDDSPVTPEADPVFASVGTGGDHSCALTEGGNAWCWGRGADGELGDGTSTAASVPVRVAIDQPLTALAVGSAHTCALVEDGSPYCWGWNAYMQRGNFSGDDGTVPVPVTGGHRFTTITAGGHHSCGINAAGEAYCWGFGQYGQLGDGTFAERSFGPVPVAGGLRFTSIDAGEFHTCGIATGGRVYCWGRNDQGQAGIGDPATVRVSQPTAVASSLAYSAVSAGTNHSCALSGGAAYCWGGNEHGQMADGSAHRPGLSGPASPAPSAQGTAFRDISAGEYVTCAVTTAGDGMCWGRGAYGQLGSAVDYDNYHPQVVELYGGGEDRPLRFREIDASGRTHVCAVSVGRALYCWGTGEVGQLGSEQHRFAPVPIRVRSPDAGIR